MGLGIAAGAFAQGYANALGLKSRLESEKQQQELTQIKLQRERDFDAAQKELAQLHSNFLDTNYDFVGGKPYEQQQGGITPPGQQRPTDPYTDSARVKAYYDRITPLLEKQAYASGKDFLGVRKQVDDLRRGQFIERVGSALSMIEAGDEAGIKNLQAVYDMYPDGRKITGGKINEDGTVLLQYEQNGQAGERVISKEQLINFGKLALNPADAAKLRFQLLESQKERDFKSGEGEKDRTFRSGEGEKDRTFRAGEGDKDRKNRLDIQAADQKFKVDYELPREDKKIGILGRQADAAVTSASASMVRATKSGEIEDAVRQSTVDKNQADTLKTLISNQYREPKALDDLTVMAAKNGDKDAKKKVDAHQAQLSAYEGAQAAVERKRTAATRILSLNKGISPQFAVSIVDDAANLKASTDDKGTYVMYGGKKVYIQ
jgi:hypothetical protein